MRGNRIPASVAAALLAVGLLSGNAFALEGSGNSGGGGGAVLPTSDEVTTTTTTTIAEPLGETETAPDGPTLALTEPAAAPSGGALPFTGADVIQLMVIGLGALGIGSVMVRRSRARRAEA